MFHLEVRIFFCIFELRSTRAILGYSYNILTTMKIENIIFGQVQKDTIAFYEDSTEICYVPEYAEGIEDCFTYLDLLEEVEYFAKQNPNYFKRTEFSVETLTEQMFLHLSWEFPSTFLEELNHDF